MADHDTQARPQPTRQQPCPTTKPPLLGGCVSGGVPKPNDRDRTVRLAEQGSTPFGRRSRPSAGCAGYGLGSRHCTLGIALSGPISERLDALVPLAEASFDRTNREELVASMILAAPVDGTKLVDMIRKYRPASAGQAKLDGRDVDRFAGVRCLRVSVVAVGLRQ